MLVLENFYCSYKPKVTHSNIYISSFIIRLVYHLNHRQNTDDVISIKNRIPESRIVGTRRRLSLNYRETQGSVHRPERVRKTSHGTEGMGKDNYRILSNYMNPFWTSHEEAMMVEVVDNSLLRVLRNKEIVDMQMPSNLYSRIEVSNET